MLLSARRGQRKTSDLLEVGLQAVTSFLIRELGTEPWSYERAVPVLEMKKLG